MKKILCLLLCIIFIIPVFSSCSKPPELSEIEGRLRELIEASQGVNEIIFGEGLPTYERIYDPIESMQYYEDKENSKRYYYYTIEDDELGDILAYRSKSYGDDFSYLLITNKESSGEDCVYHDAEACLYYVRIEYEPKKADFYYNSSIPEDYDVVRADSEFLSVDQIKEYAESVYSDEYLSAIYQTLFDGVMVSGDSSGLLTARYAEYTDDNGTVWLMKSNKYEPLIEKTRIFDLSTARILRGSNGEYVRLEIDSYLEGEDTHLTVEVALILQDGVWMLDTPTY